jgi:hypothetical protein
MGENTGRVWARNTTSRWSGARPAFASGSRSTSKQDRWIGDAPKDPYTKHRNEVLAKRNNFRRGKVDDFQWQTLMEDGKWLDLDGPANDRVQTALNSRHTAVKLPRKLHRGRCHVDLRSATYTNTSTGEQRRVRQIPSAHTGGRGNTYSERRRRAAGSRKETAPMHFVDVVRRTNAINAANGGINGDKGYEPLYDPQGRRVDVYEPFTNKRTGWEAKDPARQIQLNRFGEIMNWCVVSDQSTGGIAVEHARYAVQKTVNGPARLDKFGRITLEKKKPVKRPAWDPELLAKLTQFRPAESDDVLSKAIHGRQFHPASTTARKHKGAIPLNMASSSDSGVAIPVPSITPSNRDYRVPSRSWEARSDGRGDGNLAPTMDTTGLSGPTPPRYATMARAFEPLTAVSFLYVPLHFTRILLTV